jgi:hypothetical protein
LLDDVRPLNHPAVAFLEDSKVASDLRFSCEVLNERLIAISGQSVPIFIQVAWSFLISARILKRHLECLRRLGGTPATKPLSLLPAEIHFAALRLGSIQELTKSAISGNCPTRRPKTGTPMKLANRTQKSRPSLPGSVLVM